MIDLPTVNFIDAIAVVALLMGLLGGLKRGLSGELSRMLAIALAGFAAWRFAQPLARAAREHMGLAPERAWLCCFIVIAGGALLVLWLLRKFLRNVMDFAFKGRTERWGGALCGLLRAAVIVLTLVLVVSFAPQPEVQRVVNEESLVGRFVARRVQPLYQDLQEKVPGLGLPEPDSPTAAPETDPDLGEAPITDAAEPAHSL